MGSVCGKQNDVNKDFDVGRGSKKSLAKAPVKADQPLDKQDSGVLPQGNKTIERRPTLKPELVKTLSVKDPMTDIVNCQNKFVQNIND